MLRLRWSQNNEYHSLHVSNITGKAILPCGTKGRGHLNNKNTKQGPQLLPHHIFLGMKKDGDHFHAAVFYKCDFF